MILSVLTPIDHIKGLYDFFQSNFNKVNYCSGINHKTLSCIKNSDCLYVNPNSLGYKIDSNILSESNVKVVATASTGLDHIDLLYCSKNNIKVISATTDYDVIDKVSSTAEHAFCLMLAIVRNLIPSNQSVKYGNWDYYPYVGRQINYLKIGVVGYGRLGKMFAKYCEAFGAEVFICDPYKESNYPNLKLQDLAKLCDVISIHVHLSEETKEMINESVISNMKKCYIINTSRGGVVNEQDILCGLSSGNILGYAADVISSELTDISNNIIINNMDKFNILITPHIGGMTIEAQSIVYFHIANKLVNYLKED